jgi:hypothetical protein
VYGRSTFARFGLSVHCTQPKCPAGIAWAFPLQLINHNKIPLIIYPYTYIVQLQIETTAGDAMPYNERYDGDLFVSPPRVTTRELTSIQAARQAPGQSYPSPEGLRSVTDTVAQFEERAAKQQLLRRGPPKRAVGLPLVIEIVLGLVSAFGIGFFGNIAATSDGGHWKTVAGYLALAIGGMATAFLILSRYIAGRRQ